jgi:hypothetical protein
VNPSSRYSYQDAGFNSFMSRSRKSNPLAMTLSDSASSSSGTTLNLDRQQTNGPLGNNLTLGSIVLNGVDGRISVMDANGNEVVRIGDLGD